MSLLSLLARVLFVGHSLFAPELPRLVEAGLIAMGTPAQVQALGDGGGLLADAGAPAVGQGAQDGAAAPLAPGTGDIVLGEGAPLATLPADAGTAGAVARWAGAARAMDPPARVWLSRTWPPRGGTEAAWRAAVAAEAPLWQALALAGEGAGEGAGLVPVGPALALLSEAIEAGEVPGVTSLDAFFADGTRLNGRGTWFAAMVELAALTGKSPEGLPARLLRLWPSRDSVIGDAQARVLQRIAWQAAGAAEPPPEASALEVSAPEAAAPEAAAPEAAAPEAAAPEAPGPEAPALAADSAGAGGAAGPGVRNPRLALGLAGVNDWSVEQPFLDVMKTARPWIGHLPGQWGGMEEADLRAQGALDGDGWPLRIPPALTGIATLILTDLPEDAGGVAGRYEAAWDGRGELQIGGRAENVVLSPGHAAFDYRPGPGSVVLTLTETDPADPLRHIRVVRADRAARLAAGEIFNPDWLARIEGVRGLRFMDWLATNDSVLATPDDLPRPSDYSWARRGVPIEIVVALANRLQAEPWINVPHLADDALVRAMAGKVAAGLDPRLRVWVEYSNEMWNGQFAQARWAEEQARARWGGQYLGVQFHALRAAEVMGIWAGALPPGRLVRVIATQTGHKGLESQILEAPHVVAEGRPAPAESFDAYAVAGYFSGLLGSEEKLPAVRGWLAESLAAAQAGAPAGAAAAEYVARHRHDLADARALAELRDGSATGRPEDTLDQLLHDLLPHQAQVAAAHGLKLVMYEGGTHVVGFGPAVDDPELTAFFTHLNYTDGMAALYGDLLAGWEKLTDAPFNAYVDVATPSKWGSWGALRHLGDDNPRWDVLAKGCPGC